MRASVHIADLGGRGALRFLRRKLDRARTPGLRSADVALATPLAGTLRRVPKLGRVGLIAFWDDDASIDHFLATNPLAAILASGWQVRLEPLRMYGSWPGMDSDVPAERNVAHDGPVAVLTLARFRWRRAAAFFRTSVKAEAAALESDGMVWATAMAKPPFVATYSMWESTRALAEYAYGPPSAAHPNAVHVNNGKPFHRMEAFIRFRPYAAAGELARPNPLSQTSLSV